MDFEFKDELNFDLYLRIKVNGFGADRPAPSCSNPDNPAFSDPGDPAEVDEIEIWLIMPDGKEIEMPEGFVNYISDDIWEVVYNNGMQLLHEREIDKYEIANDI